jgi:hypothetical protein
MLIEIYSRREMYHLSDIRIYLQQKSGAIFVNLNNFVKTPSMLRIALSNKTFRGTS